MIDLTELTLKDQVSRMELLLEQFDRSEDIVMFSNSHMVGSLALSKSAIKGIKCRVTPDGDDGVWKIAFIANS